MGKLAQVSAEAALWARNRELTNRLESLSKFAADLAAFETWLVEQRFKTKDSIK
jgi:hypothetical protein